MHEKIPIVLKMKLIKKFKILDFINQMLLVINHIIWLVKKILKKFGLFN